jgi:hypothetical protein
MSVGLPLTRQSALLAFGGIALPLLMPLTQVPVTFTKSRQRTILAKASLFICYLTLALDAVALCTSVSDPVPHWIRIQWAPGSELRMRIRIQKGKNHPQKRRVSQKTRNIMKFSIFYAVIKYFRQRIWAKNV